MNSLWLSISQVFRIQGGFSAYALESLVVIALKGTVFLVGAGILTLALRRHGSAATRHLVWTLALGATLALPVAALLGPKWDIVPMPSPAAVSGSEHVAAAVGAALSASVQRKALKQAASLPPDNGAFSVWSFGALLLWAMGTTLVAGRLIVGELRARTLAKEARGLPTALPAKVLESVRAQFKFSRRVDLRISERATVPFTVGWLRPAVLLPKAARGWSEKQLKFVLAHELAHARRYDCLTQLMAQIACAAFWPHPLVWVASAQMRKERERACDDAVLDLGHEAADYAEFLLALGRGLQQRLLRWSSGTAMIHSSQLEVRMKALLDQRLNHGPLTGNRVLLAGSLAFALLLPVAAVRARGQNRAGSITVTVRDPSVAVVPNASVTLTNLDTKHTISGGTGADGTYKFSSIPPGRYQIGVSHPGFRTSRSDVLQLKPSGTIGWYVTLRVGGVAQEMTVTGHRPSGPPLINPKTGKPVRIKVGGSIEAAKRVHAVVPTYPSEAKRKGIAGTVVLQAVVGIDGKIVSLSPQSGPDSALTRSAMDAVRQWRYKPTYLNGHPVEVQTTIDIIFRLSP